MKQTIWVNGLIGGFIVAAIMVTSSILCYDNENFEGSMVLGYLGMILAFSFVFVGVKNFRDKHNSGVITFGKALKIGMLISLITSTVYVLVWLVEYYVFMPDFMEKYSAAMMHQFEKTTHTAVEIQDKTAEIEMYKELYKNPIWVILMTYAEVLLPIGILIPFIAAWVFKRKSK